MGCCPSQHFPNVVTPGIDISEIEIQSYYATASCPYAAWFVNPPPNLIELRTACTNQYNEGWGVHTPISESAPVDGSARASSGVDVNPHNWSFTSDGNTLGIVVGSLEIGLDKERHSLDHVPEYVRVGLFEHATAVIRASDFGPDGNAVKRLNRLAIKIPWAGAYEDEINLTTTALVPFFPRANWKELEALVLQRKMTWKQKIKLFKSSFSSMWRMGSEYNSGDLVEQDYYSMVAYALGDRGAFKYRFIALQENRWDVSDDKNAGRKGLKEWIENSEAKFEMQIQYVDKIDGDAVIKHAASIWDEEWVPVGVLTLAKQIVREEYCIGSILYDHLQHNLAFENKELELPYLHRCIQFHPMFTTAVYRPLGDINHFRCSMYGIIFTEKLRRLMQRDPNGVVSAKKIPFAELTVSAELTPLLRNPTRNRFTFSKSPRCWTRWTDMSSSCCGRFLRKCERQVLLWKVRQFEYKTWCKSGTNLWKHDNSVSRMSRVLTLCQATQPVDWSTRYV